MAQKFDIAVIGGGSGTKLANACAANGYKVALFENDALGGTCLNQGCIPSKMLIHTSELAREFERAGMFNLEVHGLKVQFEKLVQRVTQEVTSREKEMQRSIKRDPTICYFKSKARFIDSHTLKAGKKTIQADRIVIGTGAINRTLKIAGIDETPYLTHSEALRLKKQPKHLIVIGGGYIGVELGFYFASLGTKVTLISLSVLLKNEDNDVRKEFSKVFKTQAKVYERSKAKAVDFDGKIFRVTYKDRGKERTIRADQLLVAGGMRGATGDLGLENTKVQVDKNGYVLVNNHLRTKEKHIWAFGDVISKIQFKHKANFEADYLEQALLINPKTGPIKYPPIPYAIFSNPQIASVGKQEKDLKKGSYFIGKAKYLESGRGLAIRPEAGFVKLIFSKKDQRILGAKIVGVEASTMIHILSAFIHYRAKIEDLLKIIYIHPTLPEIIKKAVHAALKK